MPKLVWGNFFQWVDKFVKLKLVFKYVIFLVVSALKTISPAKAKVQHGFPRFKKVGAMRSFVFPKLGVDPIQGNAVKLPMIGLVKFNQSRPILDGVVIKQARVVRKASGWYVIKIQSMRETPCPFASFEGKL
jgi:putative transposase